MLESSFTKNELIKKLQGNTLGDLLQGQNDIFEALLTWNKRHINILLGESVFEQCRIINMKVDHIIGLGEWLETAKFEYELDLKEKVIVKIEEFQNELSNLINLFDECSKLYFMDKKSIVHTEKFKELIDLLIKIDRIAGNITLLAIKFNPELSIGAENQFGVISIQVAYLRRENIIDNKLESILHYGIRNILHLRRGFILPCIIERVENGGYNKFELERALNK